MKTIRPLDLATARALIDFSGDGHVAGSMPELQLEGAVAIHNILSRDGVAYLADEVGMGKTYVALGAIGLMRFVNPSMRVLFVAPRENIQRKWVKELRNFTANNWRHRDQRVRGLDDRPTRAPVSADSLLEWAVKSSRDGSSDTFLRMSCFSLGLSASSSDWAARRDALIDVSPRLGKADIPLTHRDKERFKADYATALNRVIPHYDLVVIDEAHCLRHGRASASARNKILATVLGTSGEPGLVRRVDRVLLLSATPIEYDYVDLWHQLDLLGHGQPFLALREHREEAVKREAAQRVLVRRVTQLRVAGATFTKNMYRSEWRSGGVVAYGQPLEIPTDRQRLVVALVQKKVSEVLHDPRFGANFQMGMLSSFESFMETAKVAGAPTPSDDALAGDDEDGTQGHEPAFFSRDQTDDVLAKQGIDSAAVNDIAASYQRTFGAPMPHPKMDHVVESVASDFDAGRKTLVFVRRVRSVMEMTDKLLRQYDARLRTRLAGMFTEHPELAAQLDAQWAAYERERTRRRRSQVATSPKARVAHGREDVEADDQGGNDSFFAWFFRGAGPGGVLSGAALQRNRLGSENSAYSTFFDDNYVWDLLGQPDDVLASLAAVLGREPRDVADTLRSLAAFRVFQQHAKRPPRRRVYRAYQEAALYLLAMSPSELSSKAAAVLQLLFGRGELQPYQGGEELPVVGDYLQTRTFFTELRSRGRLRDTLWPSRGGEDTDFQAYFRDRDTRRAMLSAVARLGHAYIDLWALVVTRLGTMDLGAQDRTETRAEDLIHDFLDLLESQREACGSFGAFHELAYVGEQHDLLMTVNFADEREAPLDLLARHFGQALAQQTPVAAMHGGVAPRLVRQFRMPGYPLALITTDVLQEGEDLHTFCSRVVHYGIAWTPSATEQRTGRIDRINSLVHRRLAGMTTLPGREDLLQVQFPYLADTVEKLQVERLFDRMNRFVAITHRGFAPEMDSPSVHMPTAMLASGSSIPTDRELETAFPVRPEYLEGEPADTTVHVRRAEVTLRQFERLTRRLGERVRVVWDGSQPLTARFGTVFVTSAGELAPPELRDRARQQPFSLHLRSSRTSQAMLVHAISPVGFLTREMGRAEELVGIQTRLPLEFQAARICQRPSGERGRFVVGVESDMHFHSESAQLDELLDLVRRVSVVADDVEQQLFVDQDAPLDGFRSYLLKRSRHD
ncbi:MAG: DEAD/DEAH box helicase family protein [Polyangiales bacterium]